MVNCILHRHTYTQIKLYTIGTYIYINRLNCHGPVGVGLLRLVLKLYVPAKRNAQRLRMSFGKVKYWNEAHFAVLGFIQSNGLHRWMQLLLDPVAIVTRTYLNEILNLTEAFQLKASSQKEQKSSSVKNGVSAAMHSPRPKVFRNALTAHLTHCTLHHFTQFSTYG